MSKNPKNTRGVKRSVDLEQKIRGLIEQKLEACPYFGLIEDTVEELLTRGLTVNELFDPTTGKITPRGMDAITDAVRDIWYNYLDDWFEPVQVFPALLSDREIFEYLKENVAARCAIASGLSGRS